MNHKFPRKSEEPGAGITDEAIFASTKALIGDLDLGIIDGLMKGTVTDPRWNIPRVLMVAASTAIARQVPQDDYDLCLIAEALREYGWPGPAAAV